MNAKGTVMNLNQLTIEEEKHLPDMTSFKNIAELQAEITWDIAHKAGMNEILDILKDYHTIPYLKFQNKYNLTIEIEGGLATMYDTVKYILEHKQ